MRAESNVGYEKFHNCSIPPSLVVSRHAVLEYSSVKVILLLLSHINPIKGISHCCPTLLYLVGHLGTIALSTFLPNYSPVYFRDPRPLVPLINIDSSSAKNVRLKLDLYLTSSWFHSRMNSRKDKKLYSIFCVNLTQPFR